MRLAIKSFVASGMALLAVAVVESAPRISGTADMPLADYLALLERIAPAARQGAEAFLEAHRHRCGRPLTTGELRAAIARDGGDAALMGMIRASQLRDMSALAALGPTVACRGRP